MAEIQTKFLTIDRNLKESQANAFFQQITSAQILNISSVQVAPGTSRMIVTFFDDVAPFVTRTTPVDNQQDVAPETDILVYFSEDIQVADISRVIVRRDGTSIPFTHVVSDNVLIISDAIDSSVANYTVLVRQDAIQDFNDNFLEGDFSFQFSTIGALVGSTIVALINASSDVINEENLETNSCMRRQVDNNFRRSIETMSTVIVADDVLGDDIFSDLTTDPGAGYTPSTTTASVDTNSMCVSPATGGPIPAVYYGPVLTAPGTTGVLVEAETEGTVTFGILRDAVTTPVAVTPGVQTAIASSTTLRVRAELATTGSKLHDQALFVFT